MPLKMGSLEINWEEKKKKEKKKLIGKKRGPLGKQQLNTNAGMSILNI